MGKIFCYNWILYGSYVVNILRNPDIFHKTMENKTIQTELEAWLTFLSTDDPEQIYDLIQKFPIFKEMYEDIFRLCQNTERVMDMFSKELAEMDHNTAEYMVDEMQKDLDEAREIIQEKDNELKLKEDTIQSQSDELKLKEGTIQSQSDELKKAYALIEKLQKGQRS